MFSSIVTRLLGGWQRKPGWLPAGGTDYSFQTTSGGHKPPMGQACLSPCIKQPGCTSDHIRSFLHSIGLSHWQRCSFFVTDDLLLSMYRGYCWEQQQADTWYVYDSSSQRNNGNECQDTYNEKGNYDETLH